MVQEFSCSHNHCGAGYMRVVGLGSRHLTRPRARPLLYKDTCF